MAKYLIAVLISFFASQAQAGSTVLGTIDSRDGSLTIYIQDNSARGPNEAAAIWRSIKGTSEHKSIESTHLSIKCDVPEWRDRYDASGSCLIQVRGGKVVEMSSDYGSLIQGSEAAKILSGMARTGVEEHDSTEVRACGGQLLIIGDHRATEFNLIISKQLIRNPAGADFSNEAFRCHHP